MKIRSITCFYHPGAPQAAEQLERIAGFASAAARRYTDTGYEVQTTRLATTPFPQFLKALTPEAAVELAVSMHGKAQHLGFTYLSMGAAQASLPASYELVIPMLAATKNVFLSGELATPEDGVVLASVKSCAKIIADASHITNDGFTNLRFAGCVNVKPYGPFFPTAYARDARPAFSLAIECADLVLGIFESAHSLAEARKRLIQALEAQGQALARVAEDLAHALKIEFKGIDFSMASYPQTWCSLGAALERLGPIKLGLSGSLAAAAFLADTLDRGNWPRAGFNGMMLPVLEDSTLAERATGGTLSIKDLLLYSTVCGTGLDTVPLPGDATPEQLAAVLVDVAALGVRLGKPLTARLMPIPGKKAGDPTHFDFDYFINSRVMALEAEPLKAPLSETRRFTLSPRRLH